MNKLLTAVAFFAGMAVGGAAAWLYTKDKYAKIAEEEIDSVKKFYSSREQFINEAAAAEPQSSAAEKVCEKPDPIEYAKKLQSEGYTDYSRTVVTERAVEKPAHAIPYIITPDEFGELEEYAKISLSYFADGVLADDANEEVDDPEEIVGDALAHFGEYEDDAVFVRNDAKRCDYEILVDVRNYSDVLKDLPPRG